jgi:glycosyltransferase involved in cell wall biosynthesis
MRFGLPIVGCNFGHISKFIEKHNCGLTVDPANPSEIARAVIKLLNNRALYDKMSRNGMEAVDRNYTWDIMEKKLVGLYKKLSTRQ